MMSLVLSLVVMKITLLEIVGYRREYNAVFLTHSEQCHGVLRHPIDNIQFSMKDKSCS